MQPCSHNRADRLNEENFFSKHATMSPAMPVSTSGIYYYNISTQYMQLSIIREESVGKTNFTWHESEIHDEESLDELKDKDYFLKKNNYHRILLNLI
eukprot:SAG31_NODE_16957_length_689_cov_0.798305_2_plen_97_part_00